MTTTRFFVLIIAIVAMAINVFHITFDITTTVGLIVVVSCLTAAIYRTFVALDIIK